jgi:drug/metabolite transporter (DMT)-like permease
MNRAANYAAGIGYASIFGFSFLVTKGALAALDPFELLFLRFALAACFLSLLVALRLVKVDFRGKPIKNLVLACLFQPLLYFTCETFGVSESASSTAGIVLGALPAAVALLGSFMLKERLRAAQAVSLSLTVVGVALIALFGGATSGESGSPRGFLFLLGAVASASFYNIYSRRSSAVWTPVETTFAMMLSGAIVFGAICLVRGFLPGARPVDPGLLPRALSVLPGIVYLGALSSVLAFFLINFTLSRLLASQSVVFSSLTTVISVAAGVALRGEAFGLAQLAGSIMIVAGVWGTNAFAARGEGRGRPTRGAGICRREVP